MDILLIADLHDTNYDNLNKIKDIKYDICFLLGDINIQALRYLKTVLDLEKTYGVTGNHEDFDFLKRNDIKDLHCQNININNLNIAGFSGSVRYKRGMYSMYTQEEAKNEIKKLEQCDILISHDTGYHYIDKNSDNVHDGFDAIDEFITNFNPKYNLFGHYHENKVIKKNNTTCMCIYQCGLLNYENNTIKKIF